MVKLLLFFFAFNLISDLGYSGDYNIIEFGATPNDNIGDTQAIQEAIDHCAENGGGKIDFPAGTWLSGTIFLKDNITINLSNGAILQGINDSTAFPYLETRIMSREDEKPRKAMIYGYDLHNIKICGEGTFYPGGDYPMYKSSKKNKKTFFRPFGILLIKCKNITVEGIRMKHSAFWMQRFFYCDNVILQSLDIYNHSNLNNDGIDIDGCHNVIVSNCIVDASDDALVLKSEGLRSCKDITITNCILSSHATPLKCGTGSLGGYQRITISNIVIKPSKSKIMLHPLNAWGGLSGIDLLNVDGGIMEDITINNIIMDSVETPIFIRLGNRHDTWPEKLETTPGITRNIRISNVTATNIGKISSSIAGYPDHLIENVYLSNISIAVRENMNFADTTTSVKENSSGYPFNRMFNSSLPSYGFFIRHVKNINLSDIELKIQSSEVRPGFYLEDVDKAIFNHVTIDKPEDNQSKIKIRNSKGIEFFGVKNNEIEYLH